MLKLIVPWILLYASLGWSQESVDGNGSRIEKIEAMVGRIPWKVPELTARDLQKLTKHSKDLSGAVLVDVREDSERWVSRIPGAISRREFEKNQATHRGKKVVAYCTIGYRSSRYIEQLRKKGWDAYNLRGSILSWTHADGPLIDSAGKPTKRVHVFGSQWNLVARGYEGVLAPSP